MWERKKLTTSHIKNQILQNIASDLENTENAVVALMGSSVISGGHTLPWLTRQGSDGLVQVRLWQTRDAQLCTSLSTPYLY